MAWAATDAGSRDRRPAGPGGAGHAPAARGHDHRKYYRRYLQTHGCGLSFLPLLIRSPAAHPSTGKCANSPCDSGPLLSSNEADAWTPSLVRREAIEMEMAPCVSWLASRGESSSVRHKLDNRKQRQQKRAGRRRRRKQRRARRRGRRGPQSAPGRYIRPAAWGVYSQERSNLDAGVNVVQVLPAAGPPLWLVQETARARLRFRRRTFPPAPLHRPPSHAPALFTQRQSYPLMSRQNPSSVVCAGSYPSADPSSPPCY